MPQRLTVHLHKLRLSERDAAFFREPCLHSTCTDHGTSWGYVNKRWPARTMQETHNMMTNWSHDHSCQWVNFHSVLKGDKCSTFRYWISIAIQRDIQSPRSRNRPDQGDVNSHSFSPTLSRPVFPISLSPAKDALSPDRPCDSLMRVLIKHGAMSHRQIPLSGQWFEWIPILFCFQNSVVGFSRNLFFIPQGCFRSELSAECRLLLVCQAL